jgi:uncharacterized protein (DUF1330 family)
MAAYMIAICEITNPGPGLKAYSEASAKISASYGGKYLVRGMAGEIIEGDMLKGKYIIITEFPSMDKLNAFCNDPTYKEVKKQREGTGTYQIVSCEGV